MPVARVPEWVAVVALVATPAVLPTPAVAQDETVALPEHARMRIGTPPKSPLPPGAEVVGAIYGLAVTADGARLAVRTYEALAVHEFATGELLTRIDTSESWFEHFAFSADGTKISIAAAGFGVRTWDVASGVEQLPFRLPEKNHLQLSLSPDAKLVVAWDSPMERVEVWDVAAATRVAWSDDIPPALGTPEFSQDGTTFAWSDLGIVRLYGAGDLRERARLMVGAMRIALDGAGSRLAVTAVTTISVGDFESGQLVFEKTGTLREIGSASHAITADGLLMATGHLGPIRLWDVSKGRQVAVLEGHNGAVKALAFVGDGDTLVSGGADATTIVWDVHAAIEAATADAPALESPTEIEPPKLDLHGDPLPAGATARLGSTRFRGPGWTDAIAIAPDGDWIATGGRYGLQIWETATGKAIREVSLLEGIASIAVSSDGSQLACVSPDGTEVQRWNPDGWRVLPGLTPPGGGAPAAVAYSPDGRVLMALLGTGGVAAWETKTGALLYGPRENDTGFPPKSDLAFLGDGKLFAAKRDRMSLELRETETGRIERQLEKAWGRAFAVSPDGERFALGAQDPRVVRILDLDGREVTRLGSPWVPPGSPGGMRAMRFSPDRKWLIAGGTAPEAPSRSMDTPGELRVFAIASGELLGRWIGGDDAVRTVAVSPQGDFVAWAGVGPGVHVGRLPDLEPTLAANAGSHGAAVVAVRVLADGETAVTASADGTVRHWDLAKGEPGRMIRVGDHGLRGLAVSPQGASIVAIDQAGRVTLLPSVGDRKVIHLGSRNSPWCVEFLGGGERILVAPSRGNLQKIDVTTGEVTEVGVPVDAGFGVKAPTPLADGRVLYCGPKGLSVLDPSTGHVVPTFPEAGELVRAFASDREGTVLVAVDVEGDLVLWDGVDEELRRLKPANPDHAWYRGWRTPVVSDDGKLVAATTEAGAIFVWDAKTADEVTGFLRARALPARTTCLAFSPEGTTLVVGRSDGTALVFRVTPP